MKKCLFPLDAYTVSCLTWTKNLKRTLNLKRRVLGSYAGEMIISSANVYLCLAIKQTCWIIILGKSNSFIYLGNFLYLFGLELQVRYRKVASTNMRYKLENQLLPKGCSSSHSTYVNIKIPFISNLKKPGCGSKRDVLELATIRYPNQVKSLPADQRTSSMFG